MAPEELTSVRESSAPAGELTQLLRAWSCGDANALSQLMEVVYPRLRAIAGSVVAREWGPETPQRTVLVHELYLKLHASRFSDWKDREHFFTFAAKVMRWILIDAAKARQANKRRNDTAPLVPELPWIGTEPHDYMDLERALKRLERENPRLARAVELRCFLGMTADETAVALNVSKPTVDRDLAFARAWLHRQLRQPEP
jgi:RNA polymerase sigma factor (TIGR02999 family)